MISYLMILRVVLEIYRITLLSNMLEAFASFCFVLEIYRITLLSNNKGIVY